MTYIQGARVRYVRSLLQPTPPARRQERPKFRVRFRNRFFGDVFRLEAIPTGYRGAADLNNKT